MVLAHMFNLVAKYVLIDIAHSHQVCFCFRDQILLLIMVQYVLLIVDCNTINSFIKKSIVLIVANHILIDLLYRMEINCAVSHNVHYILTLTLQAHISAYLHAGLIFYYKTHV
jgi:hypothetical protein